MSEDDRMDRTCWCGEVHPEQTDNLYEAVTGLWHMLVAKMRAPEVVAWLNNRLTR